MNATATKIDQARRARIQPRRQRRTPCNFPVQWRGSRMLRLQDGALAYTTGLPAFDVPDAYGNTVAGLAEIVRLTRALLVSAAALEAVIGGASGDAVRLRASQIREAVKRGTGIEVKL